MELVGLIKSGLGMFTGWKNVSEILAGAEQAKVGRN